MSYIGRLKTVLVKILQMRSYFLVDLSNCQQRTKSQRYLRRSQPHHGK